MKKILDLITEEMEQAFADAGYEKELARVTLSNRPDLCEYQCNGAMAGAKKYHKAPIMIAEEVVAKIPENGYISGAEAVKPGFINLKTNPAAVADYLNQMEADEKLGVEEVENPKTIVIDYGGPNVAKPLHVGHLRSAIIGESVKRITRILMIISPENIQKKHHLPSVTWRKSIRQRPLMQKSMMITEKKHWMQPSSFRAESAVTVQSGITL